MRGAAAGIALEIRLSFWGLERALFAMRAMAAAMAKSTRAPSVSMFACCVRSEDSLD